MKKFKKLPKINKNQYEVSVELDNKNYKLTEESRSFRDKIAAFISKQKAIVW